MTPALLAWLSAADCRTILIARHGQTYVAMACQMGREVHRLVATSAEDAAKQLEVLCAGS
jgi:hypothetical protein